MMRKYQLYACVILCLVLAATLGMSRWSSAQTRPRETIKAQPRKIVPQPRQGVEIALWFDKQCGASYREGEKIVIYFRTSVDSYLTLYDIDTRGQVSVLFPNRHHPDNFVRGGQTYTIPDQAYSYDLIVEGPEGIEYVDAVASTDQYYHWNHSQGEPRWIREWGLKGRQAKDPASQSYKRSSEYQNRPKELGNVGQKSISRNFDLSTQLRKNIRSNIAVRPRGIVESPRQEEYGTATCYFYVISARPVVYPTPTPYQPYQPSPQDYLRQQQRDFQQIPGFDARQSGNRLIVTIPNTILFDFDSYALRYEARRDLDQVADILRRYPETSITVVGHTDSVGDAGYNQRLSEYRAQAVANYLVSRAVQSYRISSVGYGETMPVASNASESGRQRNRRVELEIRVNPQYR